MTGTSEANKDLIRNLLADADRGQADVVERYYAPDYVDHTPSPIRRQAPGREGVQQAIVLFRQAFPDKRSPTRATPSRTSWPKGTASWPV